MKQVVIEHSSGSYPVILSADDLNKYIEKTADGRRKYFIVDANVYSLHKQKISQLLHLRDKSHFFIVPPGELSKSFRILNKIFAHLLENHYSRDSIVIAIGGGVTGDLAAFAASIYMRGIKLVIVPTTLIAAADSAIGGKTGINLRSRKNIIGSFYHPEIVLTDFGFFKTLNENDYRSGIGEIIKYAFLAGDPLYSFVIDHFDQMMNRDKEILEEILSQCIKFKGAVVKYDEKERGLRKILNLGHTFAHAFESASALKLKHGDAVNAGIAASLFLSLKKGLINKTDLKNYLYLPSRVRITPGIKKLDRALIYRMMTDDKKSRNQIPRFVLLTEPGKVIIDVPAGEEEIKESIAELRNSL